MKKWRTFISESPANPKRLLKGCEDLPGIDESWSIKTTGAGGEDALLVIGHKTDRIAQFLEKKAWNKLSIQLGAKGLFFDK